MRDILPRLPMLLTRVVLALFCTAAPALAIFNCPNEVDPDFGPGRVCRVESERDAIAVFASDETGGRLALRSWKVDGVEQIDFQEVILYDVTLGAFPELDLTTASRDEGRDQIIIVFENPNSSYGANVTYQIRGTGLNTSISLFSNTSSNSQTVFLYTNYGLGGRSNDDSIEVLDSHNGSFIDYVDGRFSSNSEVLVPAFPQPSAFDTGDAEDFAGLLSGELVALEGERFASGPGDLASVQAWSYVHQAPFSFRIELGQSIAVPEPGARAPLALLTLALIARARRSHALSSTRGPPLGYSST